MVKYEQTFLSDEMLYESGNLSDDWLHENLLYYTEAEGSSTIVLDEIYPKVEKVLDTPEGKKKFSNAVGEYVNRNSAKLTTAGPTYMVTFQESDKAVFYKLFDINEADLKKQIGIMIKQVNEKAKWQLLKNNPIFVLFYCVIRYFTIHKDSKYLNSALIITALAFYPSIFSKYFKRNSTSTVNIGVMQYTIDSMSNRFMIKKSSHIFGTLTQSIQNSWSFFESSITEGKDAECIRFIQRIRNDQNSLMKNIAREYHANYKKGLTVYTTSDVRDDGTLVVDQETDTNRIEGIAGKVITQMIVNGLNLKICDFCSNATNVSKIDFRNYLAKVIVEKNIQDMREFIESILFLYLYTYKHETDEINSKVFIAFALEMFKKTNSLDKNIRNIKNTLDKWGEDTGIYKRYSRLGTRVDYTKAIYLYFIMSIQQYK